LGIRCRSDSIISATSSLEGGFKKGEDKKRAPMGRPIGSQNKISRTMKEAVVGAVELLGSTDLDKWEKIIQKAEDDPDPYRRFFTIAAVHDMKTFMAVVGKMVPHHIVHSKAKQFMTVSQANWALSGCLAFLASS
jgi:hypothetical protein